MFWKTKEFGPAFCKATFLSSSPLTPATESVSAPRRFPPDHAKHKIARRYLPRGTAPEGVEMPDHSSREALFAFQTPMATNEKVLGTTRFLALLLLFPLGTGTTEEVLQHVRL
jgi:hypothetical protein